jgi:hypothetical protein
MAIVKGLIDPYKVVAQIEQPGDEFEVHESLQWVDLDDTVKVGWKYDPDTQTAVDPAIAYAATTVGARSIMVETRLQAYGPIGDQLDMLYKDMLNGTTLWKDKITAAKLATPSVPAPDLPGE